MRIMLALATTAVLAMTGTGCAREGAVNGMAPAGDWPAGVKEAEVYSQVLRRYLSTPGESSFPEGSITAVYVLDQAYPGVADPITPTEGGRPITAVTQQQVVTALADLHKVTFIADRATVIETRDGCEQVKDDGVLMTLGPVEGDDNEATVGVYGYVACLGATWLTYVVRNDPGTGWRVTGTTGPMAIS